MAQELFCEVCGEKMQDLPTKIVGYKAGSGETIEEIRKVCPKRRWWRWTEHSFMRWRYNEYNIEWRRVS